MFFPMCARQKGHLGTCDLHTSASKPLNRIAQRHVWNSGHSCVCLRSLIVTRIPPFAHTHVCCWPDVILTNMSSLPLSPPPAPTYLTSHHDTRWQLQVTGCLMQELRSPITYRNATISAVDNLGTHALGASQLTRGKASPM